MGKQNKLAILTSMMLMGASIAESQYYKNERESAPSLETDPIPKEPKPDWLTARQNGLKEWNFDGKIIYAATKKKALKLLEKLK